MGKRGPAPIPKEILKARGSWRGKDEPTDLTAPVEIPPAPAGIGERESEVWNQITSMLFNLRVIGLVDSFPLERYCKNLVRWRDALAYIAEHGESYEVIDKLENTRHCAYPEVGIAASLDTSLLKIEVQFGLTPSARSRITINPKPDEEKENGKARFFAS